MGIGAEATIPVLMGIGATIPDQSIRPNTRTNNTYKNTNTYKRSNKPQQPNQTHEYKHTNTDKRSNKPHQPKQQHENKTNMWPRWIGLT
jgi:hypothetical protein